MLAPTLTTVHELTLDIGSMPILVRTESAEFAQMLADRYGEFVAKEAPVAMVDLDIRLEQPGDGTRGTGHGKDEKTGYGTRDTGREDRDSGFGIRGSGIGLQTPDFGLRTPNPETLTPNPESRIPDPDRGLSSRTVIRRTHRKLVGARFKGISQVDAKTVATFSGGTKCARCARGLAGTIGKNETLAGLTDEELFGRLFRQRHGHDASLLLIAQAASLVYSFQGEATTGEGAELPVFAAMTGNAVKAPSFAAWWLCRTVTSCSSEAFGDAIAPRDS